MDRILPEERHGETAAERNDRNLGDLLQELRVAGLGSPSALRVPSVAAVHRAIRQA